MLLDIFSSFDPATSIIFNLPILFWIPILTLWVITFSTKWISMNTNLIFNLSPMKFVGDQLNRSKSNDLKGMFMIISSLFLFLIFINLTGLIPYIFGTSSHLLFTLILGLPLWLSLIFSSIINSPSNFSASFLPSGAPSWLSPALIVIETLSILVRPITLSFRLAANMSAGHIVLGLINFYTAAMIKFTPSLSLSMLFLVSTGYTMFETGICFIQAYIFCLLLTLYADEHTK